MSEKTSRQAVADKVKSREEIAVLRKEYRDRKIKVGYTSGVFDLIHPGHVAYLEEARRRCDVLVVGINSDVSVKALKGSDRPICSERDRAYILAGLASVDLVFVFSEQNNNENVRILQPDLYLKAGDYSSATLTSSSIVESFGGKTELVPFLEGRSSTSIIDKISKGSEALGAIEMESKPYERRPAVFLDRDGTINEHVEYLHEPDKFRLIPGALDGMKRLKHAGFRLVIVTNQPGIGLGYFTKEDFFRVNSQLLRAATAEGFTIDRVYFCPHTPADECACFKPGTLMVERAAKDLNIDLSSSYMVGDMTSDVLLGQKTGCRTVLVRTGRGGNDKSYEVVPNFVADGLDGAATWILSDAASRKS